MAIIMTINPIATLATAIDTIDLLKVFALFPDNLSAIKNGVCIFRAKVRKKEYTKGKELVAHYILILQSIFYFSSHHNLLCYALIFGGNLQNIDAFRKMRKV